MRQGYGKGTLLSKMVNTDSLCHADRARLPPHGKGIRKKQVMFNKDLASHSDGHLPPFDARTRSRFSGVARGSYSVIRTTWRLQGCAPRSRVGMGWIAWNGAVKMGVKPMDASGIKEICKDGKLSQALLLERAPSFQKPITQGIFFTVIRWEIEEEVPELIEILLEAGYAQTCMFAFSCGGVQGCQEDDFGCNARVRLNRVKYEIPVAVDPSNGVYWICFASMHWVQDPCRQWGRVWPQLGRGQERGYGEERRFPG